MFVDHHQGNPRRRALPNLGLAGKLSGGQCVCVRGLQGEWKQLRSMRQLRHHQDHVPAQAGQRAGGDSRGVRLVREGGH